MTYMHPRHRLMFELLSWTWRVTRSGAVGLWRIVRGERKKSVGAAYTANRGATDSPSIMATLPELESRALFTVGQPVHWRGSVYKVTARYWRRWNDSIVYDLVEVVKPGRSPRHQRKVREEEMSKPSLHTLGLQ
jgi:hypothetical protein